MSDDYRNAMRTRGEQLLREANDGVDPYRAAAFGAIRRAAALARKHDNLAREFAVSNPRSAFLLSHMNEAHAIRRAIRAAIGSDKA